MSFCDFKKKGKKKQGNLQSINISTHLCTVVKSRFWSLIMKLGTFEVRLN